MLALNKPINQYKLLFTLGLATLGLMIASNPAKAVSLVPLTSQDADTDFDDLDFNLLLDKKDFKELFVAEGRIGNNGLGGNGERELGINKDVRAAVNGGQPVTKGDLVWGNNKLWNFSLEYTGSKVTYKVFDSVQTLALTTQEFNGSVTDIFFRTFAQKNSSSNTNNSVNLSNLVLNGQAIGSLSSTGSAVSSDVDYIRVSDISTNFMLTGTTSFSWAGSAPQRSNLAFQIKVGSKKKVPEPSMLGAIFVATMTGAAALKRQKADSQQI
ncbi:choice-of-anchor W domain-containing protein [Halotia branconii]|uniref:PEP-CTERM sorting domain-containing protein n=1 Tax=Halotia branconii CENA392 TaxID=1539056 RepID=A0AAJ6NWN8_9CYAN|nr:choice-of-anchor W domain-containing protein [Halotia branconii]WGV27980.1 PEP-CTERM sorting domain-containing protein [Halotia branconii CENA392]